MHDTPQPRYSATTMWPLHASALFFRMAVLLGPATVSCSQHGLQLSEVAHDACRPLAAELTATGHKSGSFPYRLSGAREARSHHGCRSLDWSSCAGGLQQGRLLCSTRLAVSCTTCTGHMRLSVIMAAAQWIHHFVAGGFQES